MCTPSLSPDAWEEYRVHLRSGWVREIVVLCNQCAHGDVECITADRWPYVVCLSCGSDNVTFSQPAA